MEAAETQADPLSRDQYETGMTKILLVDDEPDVEGMVKLKFRKQIRRGDYDFTFAADGAEALEKLKENPDIDIVISDINMPVMDGLTLLKRLQNIDRELKAIIVSAYGDMDNIRSAMNSGAYDFVTKPIDFNDLHITIEKTRKTVEEIKSGVNALRKAEKTLQETMARNHAIVNSAEDSIITIDSQGKIESVNPSVGKMFGYDENELIGQSFSAIIPAPESQNPDEFVIKYLENMSAGEKSGKASELKALRKNGESFPADTMISKIETDGQSSAFVAMIRDITLRKKAENLLREYNQTLEKEVDKRTEQLRKLDKEKNEILGIAAHDLKNPLSNIKMLAKLLIDENLSGEDVKEFSCDILNASERMFDLIQNLLDINSIEQGKINLVPERFDISTIAKSEIDNFANSAESKGIKLASEFQTDVPTVFADRNSTCQVMDNLISNAIKYTPRGGSVVVSLEKGDGEALFAVKDSGPGIKEEEKEKLFKKFSKLSSPPTGGEHSNGLGLSIVKKLVELMGGRVWCDSVFGEGAAFGASFPYAKDSDPAY